MKIVTHNGHFHTDDIFAVAVLLLKHPDAEVVRSRDEQIIASADIAVDVGFVYDPKQNRFDHHQPGRAGTRDNGIDYASCGLVWKEFGAELTGGEREAEIIDRGVIQPIDAHDNGIAIAEYRFKGIREYAIGDLLSSYINRNDKGAERLYEIFTELVGIAKELLKREIVIAKQTIEGMDIVKTCYEQSPEKWLIEIPDEALPWREVLGEYPEPLYVLYLRRDGDWGVKGVLDTSKPYGHQRKDFPKEWGGLPSEELQRITGVPDALFSHTAGFIVAARSREGALKLANLALNS